jgi:uncharacterized MAPEG superfamily protein
VNQESLPPQSATIVEERRANRAVILASLWYTVPGTIFIVFATYTWVWPSFAGPSDLAGRLGFAIQCGFFALLPFIATALNLVIRRVNEGAHDPLAGQEGRALRVHQRVMENTLYHLVWFSICAIAISTRLTANEMRILPILTGIFIASRFMYWWAYASGGPLRRAPAGQITLTINLGLFLGCAAVFAIRGVS